VATVTGTYQDGRVILDNPVDWPNGRRVTVSSDESKIGMREEEWPTTPEGIEALLQRMDEAVAPTEEEAVDFERALMEVEAWNRECFEAQKQKQFSVNTNGPQQLPPTSGDNPSNRSDSSS
jgi:hypothetical protein